MCGPICDSYASQVPEGSCGFAAGAVYEAKLKICLRSKTQLFPFGSYLSVPFGYFLFLLPVPSVSFHRFLPILPVPSINSFRRFLPSVPSIGSFRRFLPLVPSVGSFRRILRQVPFGSFGSFWFLLVPFGSFKFLLVPFSSFWFLLVPFVSFGSFGLVMIS